MEVKKVLVVGGGTMGNGIAQVCAQAGIETTLQDISEKILKSAKEKITMNLDKGMALGKVTLAQKESALRSLRMTTELSKETADVDLAIEAIPEKIDMKSELFVHLNGLSPSRTIFASNTSSLSVGQLAKASGRPEKFIGMHFFNPVHKMKLIEIVIAKVTSEETVKVILEVSRKLGKETVRVKDSPGFVTSRMNALIGNEAFRMLEEGVATPEDIDKAIKLGLNHPMGPFEMVDLVGLDTRLSILKYLSETLGALYKPSQTLEKYVKEGRLGRKTGRGIYDYTGKD